MCFICSRSSCAVWMHSAEEQEKYQKAIDLYERAIDLRNQIRDAEDDPENR